MSTAAKERAEAQIDPAAFVGRDKFVAQMDRFVEQCHANPPLDPNRPVRLPGEQASRNVAVAWADGVALSATTRRSLDDWANKVGVDR